MIPLFEGVTDDGILTDTDAGLAHLTTQGSRTMPSGSWGSASAGG